MLPVPHDGLPMEPEGCAHGTPSKRGGSQEITQGNVVDDDFWGFPPILGVLPAAFGDLGAYGKETCKMSENQVVHHN